MSQRLAALRFFYIKTLGQAWNRGQMPYPKKARRLPSVLTQQEVAQRIDAASSSFYRMLLLTLYATGVRRAELIRLPLRDIDSRRMVVHVRGGKGRQDRDVMLSEELLRALRQHWRARRPSGCSPPGSLPSRFKTHRLGASSEGFLQIVISQAPTSVWGRNLCAAGACDMTLRFHILFDRNGPDTPLEFGQRRSRSSERGS